MTADAGRTSPATRRPRRSCCSPTTACCPLDASAAPRIAVIGWRADQPEFQGGGSAQVTPPYVITPGPGHRRPRAVRTGHLRVRAGRRPGRRRSPAACWRPTARAGGRLDYFAAGRPVGDAARTATPCARPTAMWLGEPAPGVPGGDFSARMTAAFTPDVSGPWTLSVSGVGAARLYLDGELLADTTGRRVGRRAPRPLHHAGRGRGRPRRRHHLRGGRRARRRGGRGPDRHRRA